MSVQTSAGVIPETDAELVRRGDAILADLARLVLELRHQVYEVQLPVGQEALTQYLQHHAATMVELGRALDHYAACVGARPAGAGLAIGRSRASTSGPGGQLA